MSQTFYNDIYHGNAPFTMTQTVVCKAGEGADFTDPSYQDFIRQGESAGHAVFAYYALHRGTGPEMVAQANRAHSIIGKRPAMYDVENWKAESGSPAGVASLSMVTGAVDAYRAAGGVMNVIYLPRSQWQMMGSPSLQPLMARRLHLVNADYRAGSVKPGSAAWQPIGGMPVSAVQYAPCRDVVNGSLSDLIGMWGGEVPPPTKGPVSGGSGPLYTVVKGDTMSGIAAKFGMSLGTLEHLNPSAGHPAGHFDLIQPGDRLVVTLGAPVSHVGPETKTYTVQAGDNMTRIAIAHHMTLAVLEHLNPHAGHPAGHFDLIRPGDHLTVYA